MSITDIVFNLLLFSFAIQIVYVVCVSSRITFHKDEIKKSNFGISIIICARNELSNLKQFLPEILNQNHPEFEVIVVNDRSWDESLIFLNKIKKKITHLKVVNIVDNGTDHFGKKLAITLGIKAAKYDNLIFTDADCYPSSENWLNEMSSGFNNEKEIVLGASTYQKEKGFLNRIIRFDTAQIAINYMGFAKSKIPYMGIGRNLGYNRKTYENARGFKSHYHIESGDDDLFINENSNRKNTAIVFGENNITVSIPKKTFKNWIRQKKRHHTTNSHYKLLHKILLTAVYISTLTYYSCIFSLLISCSFTNYVIGIFMIRTLVFIALYYRPFKILLCKDLLIALPVYEIILLISLPIIQLFRSK